MQAKHCDWTPSSLTLHGISSRANISNHCNCFVQNTEQRVKCRQSLYLFVSNRHFELLSHFYYTTNTKPVYMMATFKHVRRAEYLYILWADENGALVGFWVNFFSLAGCNDIEGDNDDEGDNDVEGDCVRKELSTACEGVGLGIPLGAYSDVGCLVDPCSAVGGWDANFAVGNNVGYAEGDEDGDFLGSLNRGLWVGEYVIGLGVRLSVCFCTGDWVGDLFGSTVGTRLGVKLG